MNPECENAEAVLIKTDDIDGHPIATYQCTGCGETYEQLAN